ncbi:MAG TPA: isochorismatase family protein [Edaphobacter sp.]
MAVTQLDEKAALVVIDLQKGIVAFQLANPTGEIVDRSARLAKAFRERGLPVVLVNVNGRAPGRTQGGMLHFEVPPDFAEIVAELDRQPTDHVVTKLRIGAFLGTDLDAYLRERGVTQVFFTGVATSVGVESTARSAYDLGYNVVFVSDAMTDLKADMHQHSIEKVFPRIGELATTDEVLALLSSREVAG